MLPIDPIVLFVVSLSVALVSIAWFYWLFRAVGWTDKNFRQEAIPTSIGFAFVFTIGSTFMFVCGMPLLTLSANAINLLGRRPSRALKGYAFVLIVIGALGSRGHLWLMIPITVAAIVYAPLDFRRKAMMGDAGSNALGAAAGIFAALDLALPAKAAAAALLLAFNLGSEKISYTRVIESNGVLKWLDRWGVAE